ncbi:MAG TPA: hypothetical protein ENK16_09110 [Chromatiales bacterium]|nr:hypothetical protein [Chromatiales bacterium]
MHIGTTLKNPERRRSRGKWTARLRRILLTKLWLPRIVYELIPAVYILLGVGALASALYGRGWTWIVPYLVLIGVGCLHAGLAIAGLRYRFRRRQQADPPDAD